MWKNYPPMPLTIFTLEKDLLLLYKCSSEVNAVSYTKILSADKFECWLIKYKLWNIYDNQSKKKTCSL